MDIAKLALEDGTVFTGTAFGARGEVDGEVVFNTSMTGYQEILTDPSYHGQIVAMTYPQIGNYGVNDDDAESRRPWVRGFVIRELSGRVSNFRAGGSLESTSSEHGIIGIEGIDTRALVRLTREQGAMKGILSTTDLDDASLVAKAKASPGLVGRDLAREVMPGVGVDLGSRSGHDLIGFGTGGQSRNRSVSDAANPRRGGPHVVALDFGMKWNILRHLVDLGCKVTVVPGSATGRGDPRPRARRDLHLQRARRSAAAHRSDGHPAHAHPDRRRVAGHPDLRDLPGPPAPGPGVRGPDVQAQVRPPRRQSPGPQPADRQGRDHHAEPRLRRRPRDAAGRRRAQPHQPQRPDPRGPAAHAVAGLQRPVSPRGLRRPAR